MAYKVPKSHPRRDSILVRERLVKGFHDGLVCGEGLIAQGRGEAFDYLLGERTTRPAGKAAKAAAAAIILAKKPVISVNGNLAALCPAEVAGLAEEAGMLVEVNLFYRTEKRARAIGKALEKAGAKNVLGVKDAEKNIPGLGSERGRTSKQGIHSADLVLVSMEDGDRTEALKRMGKKVIAIDLNPLARTSKKADITVVDNVTRAFPRIAGEVRKMKGKPALARRVLAGHDNKGLLRESLRLIKKRLETLSK